MNLNISAELFTQHWGSWLLICLVLAFLIYTMRVIKKEKEIFIENAITYQLGPYELSCPNWWSVTERSDSHLRFERTDTRYDWFAVFKIEAIEQNDVIESFKSKITSRDILFDEDAGVIHEQQSLKQHVLKECDVARVEGTATQRGIDRIYYDALLAIDNKNNLQLWAESRSSILNGLVEGPYFEYVVQNIK